MPVIGHILMRTEDVDSGGARFFIRFFDNRKVCHMIQSTTFGSMTIDGRTFHSDLIIFPDGRVQDNWWRRRGHVLAVDDIVMLADRLPEIIVAGTGTSGRMRPAPDLLPFLEARNIALIAEVNSRAVDIFNQKIEAGVKVGGCFHLTC
jgi:hypothetical protein